MIDLFYDNYDGEMLFDISDVEKDIDGISFVIKANYNDSVVGAKVFIPTITRKALFKTITLLKTNAQLSFSSIGEESDNLIICLEQLLKPKFKSSKAFTDQPEGIDFAVLNNNMFEINLDSDKVYLKLFNAEDQSEYDEDERIDLEMNFSFNLSTKRASLVEIREGYSADLVAILMK